MKKRKSKKNQLLSKIFSPFYKLCGYLFFGNKKDVRIEINCPFRGILIKNVKTIFVSVIKLLKLYHSLVTQCFAERRWFWINNYLLFLRKSLQLMICTLFKTDLIRAFQIHCRLLWAYLPNVFFLKKNRILKFLELIQVLTQKPLFIFAE